MTSGSQDKAAAVRRRIWLVLGGLVAWILGGPVGFLLACLFIFIVRMINLNRERNTRWSPE